MNRREVIVGASALGLMPAMGAFGQEAGASLQSLVPAWNAWKAAYLQPDGRIVDVASGGASHSESQGYGLYLAVLFRDVEAFRLIYSWTEANLALRTDGLLAWRWLPDATPNVPDMNNASDGDVFYAWALLMGADLFDLPQCRGRAGVIVKAVVRLCLPPVPNDSGRRLLAPGVEGFVRPEGIIYNPSYWMPKLMSDLAVAFNEPSLQRAVDDGLARLGEMADAGLAPDWMMATPDGWTAAPEGFSSNTGYEAMRVPVYLCLSGQASHPMVRRYRTAYEAAGLDAGTPTVFDGKTGEVLERSPDIGYAALAGLASCTGAGGAKLPIPLFTTDQPYYPATLHLFVLIAQIQGFPQCQPI